MEDKLVSLLRDHEIAPEVVTHLLNVGVVKMDDLATVVDKREELGPNILQHTVKRDDTKQLLRLKQAWRIANDDYEVRRSRLQQGWTEEEIEILYKSLTTLDIEWQMVITKSDYTDKLSYF